MGSFLKRALVVAPAATASDSAHEITPFLRARPHRLRRAADGSEEQWHRLVDNACRLLGDAESLFDRRHGDRFSSRSSMHLRAALVDTLVGSCFPGPHAAERGRTGMLSLVAGGLLQAHGILDAYGGAIGDAEWGCQAREGEACCVAWISGICLHVSATRAAAVTSMCCRVVIGCFCRSFVLSCARARRICRI